MNRWLVALAVALAVTAFFWLGLDDRLTLAALQNGRDALVSAQAANPWVFASVFFASYLLMAALSVPGAAVMTVAAGAMFGLVAGTVLVWFASTLGATAACALARYVLRGVVERRFADRLAAINAGLERDGTFYLLTLRLVPLFPFFVVNLAMGLTRMRLRTFYWVSQLGMLAGTLAYVYAGTELGRLRTLADVASLRLWAALLLLAAVPWLAPGFVAFAKRRRVYARWRRPRAFGRNLVVIGAGAGGLVTAYLAAALRAKVTLVEAGNMGGDCLNYGCVPSKTLLRSAKLAHDFRHADRYGLVPGEPKVAFRAVMARVHDSIAAIAPHDSVERYTKLGVEVVRGHATLIDPWTVDVTLPTGDVRRLTTRSIVIAAGARPFVPPLPGIEQVGCVTSDTLWERFATLDAVPPRLVVLGGGPIGCELAQAFARLGSNVTLVETNSRLLMREDEDASALVRAALERDGVSVLTDHRALRCERAGGTKAIVLSGMEGERRIEFDELLCAVGRVPRLQGYGLEALGIPTARTVVANEYLETLYPNVFAAGDVAGPYQFTHMASHQAWYATVNALFGHIRRFKVDYTIVPRTTFTDPEIAHVGLGEREAVERGIEHEVTRYELSELDRAVADGAAEGFVKVITGRRSDRILGVTIAGAHAGELLAEFVLAIKHGLGLNKVLGTIHAYPTWAEANKNAAGEWRRTHAPQRLLAWLERYHAWQRG